MNNENRDAFCRCGDPAEAHRGVGSCMECPCLKFVPDTNVVSTRPVHEGKEKE